MTHAEVLEKFKLISHTTDEQIVCWWPNGRNSIRVKLTSTLILVFTFFTDKRWSLETFDFWTGD